VLFWQLANEEPIDQKQFHVQKAHMSHDKLDYNQFHQSLFTEKLWETCRAVLEQFKPLILGGMDSYTHKIILLTTKGIHSIEQWLFAIDPIKEQYLYWGCCRALASSNIEDPSPLKEPTWRHVWCCKYMPWQVAMLRKHIEDAQTLS